MKDVQSEFKDMPDTVISIAEAIDDYLASSEFSESRKEAMKEAFVESLENRAKSLMGNERATKKSAEQVLLDSLLYKLNAEVGKSSKPGSKAYQQRLREALENSDFSDGVWRTAISNVSTWLGMQDMDAVEKAEIISRLEDAASAFMDKPFSKSDIRTAVKEGDKDLSVSVAQVVKRHFSEQNKTIQTLAEKLVTELGLSAEAARKYEQAVIEEARSYMDDKRMAAIRQALSLDKAGRKREPSTNVDKRIIDKFIEGVNLGMLDDVTFRGAFSEKYGLFNLTPEMIKHIHKLNDLIYLHEGTDISRRYTKELADFIEAMKPRDAVRMLMFTQSFTIKGMLTGLPTLLNISVGSTYSFFASALPTMMMNPLAVKAFLSEYKKAGLTGTSRNMFKDIMIDGNSPLDEGLGGKYDDREVFGDAAEYFIKAYDMKKLRSVVAEAKTPKDMAKALAIVTARTYVNFYRISNFAKAFDVLLSTRGTDFELFLKYWTDLSKEAGHPFKGRFDPSVSAKFMDKLRDKMGYDPEGKAEIESSVNEQIAGMKARGERVGPSFKNVLTREAMIAKRNMIEHKQAQERVRSFLLMEDPTGGLGLLYNMQKGLGTIKEDDSVLQAVGRLGYSVTLGLFLRIAITASQRSMENIPVIGILTPGVMYDWVPTDISDPKSKRVFRTLLNKDYDSQAMKRKLATNAAITALTVVAAMNIFVLKDDEEPEDQEDGTIKMVPKKRLELNPDRIIDLTGSSGEFFKAEQYSKPDDARKDYYMKLKINNKWENVAPVRLVPHLLFTTSVLGGLADDIKMNPNSNKKKRDQLIGTFDDFALGFSEFSFATNAKLFKSVVYANQREGMYGAGMEIAEFIVRPWRTSIYPNAIRDAYKEMRVLTGSDEKIGEGVLGAISNDFPILEDMTGESTYDIFGNPKKVTSKFLQVASETPAVGVVINNLVDYKNRNEDRFNTDAWRKKMQYFPFVTIEGYWPSGYGRETKTEASKVYGELMREWIESKPDKWFSSKSQSEIDEEINGVMKYDGTRKGGVHGVIIKNVKDFMEMDKLTNTLKQEEKLLYYIREMKSMENPTKKREYELGMKNSLERLADIKKRRKTLQDKLDPNKRND